VEVAVRPVGSRSQWMPDRVEAGDNAFGFTDRVP